MNRVFIISFFTAVFLCALPLDAGAQTVYSRGKLYVDGQPLAVENASLHLSAALSADYAKALTAEKVGSVLAYTGGGVALASGAVWAISRASYKKADTDILPAGWGIGIAGMAVGSAIAAGGLVTYLVGRNQVRLIGEQASASSQVELDLGFTPSGIGLALNF